MRLLNYQWAIAVVFMVGCSSTQNKAAEPIQPPQKASDYNPGIQVAHPAAVRKDHSMAEVISKLDSDERKLEVAPQGKGCGLKYTKSGKGKVIATSSRGNSHCTKFMGPNSKEARDLRVQVPVKVRKPWDWHYSIASFWHFYSGFPRILQQQTTLLAIGIGLGPRR